MSQEEFERTYLEPAKGTKKATPWLDEDVVEARCIKMGLRGERVQRFIDSCEFVSLGSFCGVARSLQSLGLKRFTYPFDWVRTSVPSTVTCLDRNFADFCTSSFVGSGPEANPSPGVQLRGGAKWGGSFWHHDPHNAKVQQDFARRIERLQGFIVSDVPPDVTRVFCVSLNALADLAAVPALRVQLRRMLPRATIYLLVLIDNQPVGGLIRVASDSMKTLFHRTRQDLFHGRGENWTEQQHVEDYASGLAAVLNLWANNDNGENIPVVESYTALYASCSNFYGGNPAETQYWPLRIMNEQPPDISVPQPELEIAVKSQDIYLSHLRKLVSDAETYWKSMITEKITTLQPGTKLQRCQSLQVSRTTPRSAEKSQSFHVKEAESHERQSNDAVPPTFPPLFGFSARPMLRSSSPNRQPSPSAVTTSPAISMPQVGHSPQLSSLLMPGGSFRSNAGRSPSPPPARSPQLGPARSASPAPPLTSTRQLGLLGSGPGVWPALAGRPFPDAFRAPCQTPNGGLVSSAVRSSTPPRIPTPTVTARPIDDAMARFDEAAKRLEAAFKMRGQAKSPGHAAMVAAAAARAAPSQHLAQPPVASTWQQLISNSTASGPPPLAPARSPFPGGSMVAAAPILAS